MATFCGVRYTEPVRVYKTTHIDLRDGGFGETLDVLAHHGNEVHVATRMPVAYFIRDRYDERFDLVRVHLSRNGLFAKGELGVVIVAPRLELRPVNPEDSSEIFRISESTYRRKREKRLDGDRYRGDDDPTAKMGRTSLAPEGGASGRSSRHRSGGSGSSSRSHRPHHQSNVPCDDDANYSTHGRTRDESAHPARDHRAPKATSSSSSSRRPAAVGAEDKDDWFCYMPADDDGARVYWRADRDEPGRSLPKPWWPTQDSYSMRDFVAERRTRDGRGPEFAADWDRFDTLAKSSQWDREFFERTLLRAYYTGMRPISRALGYDKATGMPEYEFKFSQPFKPYDETSSLRRDRFEVEEAD